MALDFALPIPLTMRSTAAIAADTYTPINVANPAAIQPDDGLPISCFYINVTSNAAANTITISFDGVTPHMILLPGTSQGVNFQTNAAPQNFKNNLKKGTIVYIQGTAAADGIVYLSGWYQPFNVHDIV